MRLSSGGATKDWRSAVTGSLGAGAMAGAAMAGAEAGAD